MPEFLEFPRTLCVSVMCWGQASLFQAQTKHVLLSDSSLSLALHPTQPPWGLHEAGPVPLGAPVVVVHVVSAPQVVHLLFPPRRQRRRWQLLLTLRCGIAGIHHVPAMLRNEGKSPLWLQCVPHFSEKELNPHQSIKEGFPKVPSWWLGAKENQLPTLFPGPYPSSAADSTIFLEISTLPQNHPSDHCFLPLGHHFWAYTPS